jgi:hypothetical protein
MATARKKKVTDDGQIFKEQRTKDYCLQLLQSVLKEYNFKHLYETKHKDQYNCFIGQLRNDKINSLKSYLCQQQNIFQQHCNETKAEIHVSYKVVKQLAKKGKPFTDAEFVELCILATVKELCPEKIKLFQDISPFSMYSDVMI